MPDDARFICARVISSSQPALAKAQWNHQPRETLPCRMQAFTYRTKR